MKLANHTLQLHSIESFGTHDGPGIRMVIFLQGCNIACKYCHNPDTMSLQAGKSTSIQSLLEKAIRMKPYFGEQGGVTISGGEPLLQSKALIPFFEALKKENILINIDTNATVRTPEAQEILSKHADLVMFDIKSTYEAGFKLITGKNHLEQMLANIALREASKKPYWLRYVLVPSYTDAEESFQFLIDTFSKNQYLERIEILPYNRLGLPKWDTLGWKYELNEVPLNTAAQKKRAYDLLVKHFKFVQVN